MQRKFASICISACFVTTVFLFHPQYPQIVFRNPNELDLDSVPIIARVVLKSTMFPICNRVWQFDRIHSASLRRSILVLLVLLSWRAFVLLRKTPLPAQGSLIQFFRAYVNTPDSNSYSFLILDQAIILYINIYALLKSTKSSHPCKIPCQKSLF